MGGQRGDSRCIHRWKGRRCGRSQCPRRGSTAAGAAASTAAGCERGPSPGKSPMRETVGPTHRRWRRRARRRALGRLRRLTGHPAAARAVSISGARAVLRAEALAAAAGAASIASDELAEMLARAAAADPALVPRAAAHGVRLRRHGRSCCRGDGEDDGHAGGAGHGERRNGAPLRALRG